MKIDSKLLLIITVLLFGCQVEQGNNQRDSKNVDSRLIRNGMFINHQQCGDGDIALVFVHGWCINQSYWSSQVNTLCEDYKLVTLDLPGFGESGKSRTDWSIEEYGKDVNFLIQQLKLDNVILVGHSMGGDVILEAALQNDKVIALIGVDNFKDVGMEINEDIKAEIDAFMNMLKENFSQIAPAYAEGNLFHSSTDSQDKLRVMNDFGSADSLAAIGSIQSLIDYAPKETVQLSSLSQKLYLINSNATPTDTVGLNETGVEYEIIDIDSTGHYPMIEKPDDFNRLLKLVVEKIEETRSSTE